MIVEQFYTKCLAHGAYYICNNGECAIIDPLREIDTYLDIVNKNGSKLKYIFETHFHADFVSGHLDLAYETDATIVYGPQANPEFECYIAKDEEVFFVGKLKIKILHTPGHTLESSCYLLHDEEGNPTCLFSGDTLFLGDVGRPDLAQGQMNLTKEHLAGILFDSLNQKILPLPDHVLVYPAHGSGSACGKNMMKETVDTLGNQKKINYALKQSNKLDFIREVLEDLPEPPSYFSMNVLMNKKGYENYKVLNHRKMNPLNVGQFKLWMDNKEVIILDSRNAGNFCKGFIPGSINIGLDGQFAPWVGAILGNVNQQLLIISEPGKEEETIKRLARIGFDSILGYLEGGFLAWKEAGESVNNIHRISAADFEQELKNCTSEIIDVRKANEFNSSHVCNAQYQTLEEIPRWINEFSDQYHKYFYCGGGYRSMIACSILKKQGFHNFTEIDGGFASISKTGIQLV